MALKTFILRSVRTRVLFNTERRQYRNGDQLILWIILSDHLRVKNKSMSRVSQILSANIVSIYFDEWQIIFLTFVLMRNGSGEVVLFDIYILQIFSILTHCSAYRFDPAMTWGWTLGQYHSQDEHVRLSLRTHILSLHQQTKNRQIAFLTSLGQDSLSSQIFVLKRSRSYQLSARIKGT